MLAKHNRRWLMGNAGQDIDICTEDRLDEFDIGTTIMTMTNGSLRVRFGLMPPSWCSDEGAFESFDEKMSEALGVDVDGLDKEFFGIEKPKSDTVATLHAWLLDLRKTLEGTAG